MGRWGDEVSGAAAGILALSIIGGIALVVIVAGAVLGAVTGLAVGGGVLGYRYYKKKKLGPWDEKSDATGFGLFEPGGSLLGEEVRWD
jgi:hypothetical protein